MRPRSRRSSRVVIQVLIGILLLAVLASGCAGDQEIPPLERRSQELNRSIMCPVCPGESIDQSQNPLAVSMRGIVAERLEEGWTEGQITDFFVERYGPSVLMEPPSDGANVVVWLVPPLGLALAGVALFAVLRQMRRKEPLRDEGAHVAIGPSGLEGEEYRRRALVALAGEGLESPDESFGESSESREEGAI